MSAVVWTQPYGTSASLRLEGAAVTFERASGDGSREREVFAADAEAIRADRGLLERLCVALSLEDVTELLALLALRERTSVPAPPADGPGVRPEVARVLGGGRGDSSCVWLFGRSVTISAGGLRFEGTFDDVPAGRVPLEVRAALGDARYRALESAVALLAPWPCACDTGAQTPREHGTIAELAALIHPSAPIDVSARVGYCTVCARRWTFSEAGDSHYSYSYSVRPFDKRE